MRRRDMLTAATLAAGSAAMGPARAGAHVGRPCGVRTRDGVNLFVRGFGVGPPVLFVHSWALESAMWDRQTTALARAGFACHAFDRRGHGRSDAPATGYDLDTLAEDLAAVIDQADLSELVLVGHSMGCAEIVRYLSRHGASRVRRVVLLAPTTPYLLKTADNPYGIPKAVFEAVRAEWEIDFPKWIDANKAAFFTAETSTATIDWLAAMMSRTSVPVAAACNETLVAADLRNDLTRVKAPVLIIHGDKDVSAPLEITGRRTAAGIGGAALKVVPGAPHGLFITHAAQVNAEILAFIRS